eukprot:TRINITY_DN295_c0_g1_i3.p1 TRINITY_DN295_c0_g1~~TRINITY_DN295_c0_g1_i3.p1  ORF type:complete len:341 (+),score=64.87 TRINITY_DN295_c0_g1_i3:68-1090(+)
MLRVSLLLSAAAQTVFASQVFGAFDSNPSDGRTVNPEPNEGRAAIRCCTNKYCRSKDLNNKCLGESASIEEAEAACARMDMRLCNNEELHSGMCKGTGCGYDRHPVWGTVVPDRMTVDSCTVDPNVVAEGEAEVGAVRCCSKNGKACISRVNSDICLGHSETFEAAVEICKEMGRRLCTRSELRSGICCKTGCDYDMLSTWSIPDGSCSSQSIPAPMKSSAAVRCCSTDGSTCTSLSPNSNTCLGEVSSYEAEAICTSINMRTCTRSEVASNLCCGTGCSYDHKPVWSDEDKIKHHLFMTKSDLDKIIQNFIFYFIIYVSIFFIFLYCPLPYVRHKTQVR